MSLIIDLSILAIIALFTFIGYKQGLIKSALKILTFFIAIIITVVLYKPVANFITNNTTIDETIKETIVEKLLPEGTDKETKIEEQFSIPNSIIKTANKTIEEIGQSFAIKIIEVSTFLVLFITTKIILKFVSVLSTLITKLPIIKQLDKTGGTIYGLIKGILIVYFIFAIINLISPFLQQNILDFIDKLIIGKIFYEYNLLLLCLF